MTRNITNVKRILFSVLVIIMLVSITCQSHAENEPIYIGVLLPLTGPEGQPFFHALQLSLKHINDGGGIGGRPVELILRDTASGDLQTYAEDLAHDPRIWVVIGPFSSDDLFSISHIFTNHDKVLISPTATSDEIYRAFAGTGRVWRTVTNDVDIISVVMQHLSSKNAKDIAILTVNNSYGKTFYDWIPFWAIELGINITESEEYSAIEEIPDAVRRLCSNNPDYLIFVNPSVSGRDISLVIETMEELNSSPHLYTFYPNIDENGLSGIKWIQRH